MEAVHGTVLAEDSFLCLWTGEGMDFEGGEANQASSKRNCAFLGTGSNGEANNSEQIFGILCEWCIKLESRKRCRFSETEGNCIDL